MWVRLVDGRSFGEAFNEQMSINHMPVSLKYNIFENVRGLVPLSSKVD